MQRSGLPRLALIGLALASLGAVAGPTPVGSIIDNTAVSTYMDTASLNRLSNPVRVTTTSSAAAVVTQSESAPVSSSANADLPFTVSASATASVFGVPVFVDGVFATLVTLRTPIPANTVFSSAQAAGAARVLLHRRGDPDNQFVTTADPTLVDAVVFAQPLLDGSTTIGGRLVVRTASNASGTISNTSTIAFTDSTGAAHTQLTNVVSVTLPVLPSVLSVYGTPSYQRPIVAMATGGTLFLQLDASRCNLDSAAVEQRQATVRSQGTGDLEAVTLNETGANTGLFRAVQALPTVGSRSAVAGDGTLQTFRGDTLVASVVGCGADATADTILVDPAGIVFDSHSNAPVPGSTVTLIDVSGSGNGGQAGGAAKVYGFDGVTPSASTVTTDATGAFQFPNVLASQYKLQLTLPPGYRAPSTVQPEQLPGGRKIDRGGSYLGAFAVAGQSPVLVDVPVDAAAVDGLFVEKTASKALAEIGDFVDYRVTVRNTSSVPLAAVALHDALPRGFLYQHDSVFINGIQRSDPMGSADLTFMVGTIAPSGQAIVTYRLRLGAGAQGGDGVNRAYASSGLSQSNVSSAKVTLNQGGVFSDRGFLIGKVYADCNANRTQDPGELGIPGVRIVLEDGTSAITDEDGKYSLYGLLPRTHVAKIDDATLPPGSKLEVLSNRNAGDGRSRFIDLQNGELHRGDFAVTSCGPALTAEIARRRALVVTTEASQASRALLTGDKVVATDTRALPSSGVLDARGIVGRTGLAAVTATPALDLASRTAAAAASDVIPTVVAPVISEPEAVEAGNGVKAVLGPMLEAADPTLAFIDLPDGAVVAGTRITVNTKGPIGAKWVFEVNGVAVGEDHVAERTSIADRKIQGVSYIGVELQPGENLLALVGRDAFGNERGRQQIKVVAPGDVAHVEISAPTTAVAVGQTRLKLTIRLTDAHGTLVPSRTALTVDSSLGILQAKDLDPRAPGLQVFVEGGEFSVDLLPPTEPGKATILAAVGKLKTERVLVFEPNLRPLIAVGVIEGVINLHSLSPNSVQSAGNAFEREIQNVSRQFADGRGSAEARGALYLKGKVLGSNLLTLAYDSDKPQRERLFRDIQPDQFYPVYGDSSTKGFDAQSTSRLYVRVDHGQSFVLYGDLTTQTDNPARALTQYNRTLTGAQTHIEQGPVSIDAFAAQTSSRQQIDEFPANGTSGPFVLSRPNGLVNSEQIHVLTRVRNQPAVILKDVALTRFADYEMEPLTGRILFKAPIPSLDIDLNPLSIRVTYEVDAGGASFFVGGVDAKVAVTDNVTVGGVFIRDTDPTNRSTIKGVNSTIKVADKATLTAEVAQTDSDLYGSGRGKRVEYRQDGEIVQARVYAGKTDADFNNPSALLSQGRAEYGGKVAVKVGDRDRVIAEAIKTEDVVTGGKREGVLVTEEHSFDGNVKVEVGARHVDETLAPAQPESGTTPNHFTSLRAKVTVPVPYLQNASVFGEYERAIDTGDTRQVAALGGTYQLPWGGKLYARHEFISSLTGAYDLNSTQRLNTTVFGVDTDYMKDGHVFNEYRVGDGIDGRTAESAIGLRNLWRIADGLNVTTTGESIKPLSGVSTDKSMAVTGAIDYTALENLKSSGRIEYRDATSANSYLVTAGSAYKLDDATTLLGKAIYSDLQNGGSAGLRRISRGQLGVAYRPVDTNVWNALGRIEVKRELDTTLSDAPIDEVALIASAHVNVMPTPDWSFNGRYAIKRATDRSNGLESHSVTQMIGGRVVYDLNDHWDLGASAFVLANRGFASRQYALGLEAGYQVQTNLWVSFGYNLVGFLDRDLSSEEYTQRGVYLRMRYKFDESLFGKPSSSSTP